MQSQDVELVCKEIVELVTEYLGDALSPRDRTRFEDHLSTCPPCTAYLAQMKTTFELAAELGSAAPDGAPPGDEVAAQLGDIFRRWHEKRR
ncbi:MAG TPA: zf-HC2 domain-containing protein [Polyangia bacterium]